MLAKTITLLVIIFLCNSYYSYGQLQAWVIKGRIVGKTGLLLSPATITLLDTTNREVTKTTTGNSGDFHLSYNVKGRYALVVSFTGYQAYRLPLFELQDKDFGTITLNNTTNTLDEVKVQSKQNLVELEGNSIIYNVSKSIDAQGTSAFEALKKAPGIYVDNETTITLNGKPGAMIMLDGKQTYLSGRELIDLLKSMPSSNIRSIEIINSPGAKFDATGSAGIINIRTNKNQVKGFNGTANVGVAYGITIKQNQDISFNYRKNKLNVYGGYNHALGNYNYVYGGDRIQTNKTFNSVTDDTDKRKRMGTRLGVDYNLNKLHTIGVLLNANYVFGGGLTYTKTDIGIPSSPIVNQVLDAYNDYYFQQTDRYNLNLNYKYEDAAGRILNVDGDWGSFKKGNANLQSNIYSNNQGILSSNLYRTLNNIGIDLKALKVDYTAPFKKGVVEAGAKHSNIHAFNNSRFFHAKTNKDSLDERRSNTFGFNEQITSGYVSYKKTIQKWSFQGGVRLENTSSLGDLYFKHSGFDSNQLIRRNYTNWFPNVSIAVKPTKDNSFSLAYSKRIDRPAYQDLNPFEYLLDELSFWKGNPFLQPQLTDRIALLYAYKSATIIGLNFSHTTQFSANITDTVDAVKIVMVQRNLGVQRNASLTLTQNIFPTKGWDITFNGTFYYLQNEIAFDQYRNFNLKQFAGRFNLQQTFKLPYKLTGEISGTFNSRRLTGANELTNAVSILNVGVQRKLLKEKGTLRLVLNDIYQGSRATSIQSYQGFYLRSFSYYETRQIRLNFSYRFADSNVKGPRTRNSALETESGRIK